MVSIVVNDENVSHVSFDLESPLDSREFRESLADNLEPNIEFERSGCRGHNVIDIMHPWHTDPQSTEAMASMNQVEGGVKTFKCDSVGPKISLGCHPIGDEAFPHLGKNRLNVPLIEAENSQPVEGNFVEKLKKCLPDCPDVRVVIHVFQIDGCDDGYRR